MFQYEPEPPSMDSLAVTVLAATSKNTTSPGSTFASLIFLAILFGAAYLLFIRPRSAAVKRQRQSLQEVVPGDEVMTTAGIFGTVVDVAPDRVTIETAPGTRLTVLRSAIARRITPQPDLEDEEGGAEDVDDDDSGELGASGNGHGPGVREPADPADGEAGS